MLPAGSSQRAGARSGRFHGPIHVPQIRWPALATREMAKANLTTLDLRWLGRSVEVLALATFVVLFFVVPDGAAPWVLAANLVTFYLLFLRALAVPDRILPWLPSYLSIEVLFFGFSYLIFYYQYQLFLFGATDLSVSSVCPTHSLTVQTRPSRLRRSGCSRSRSGTGSWVGPLVMSGPTATSPEAGATSTRHFAPVLPCHGNCVERTAASYCGPVPFRGLALCEEGRYTGTTTRVWAWTACSC